MPALSSLVDDFDDDTIDTTKWPTRSAGGTETGGRARVPAVAGQYDYWVSGAMYSLAEASVHCRVYPPDTLSTGDSFGRINITNAADGTIIIGTVVSSGFNYIGFFNFATSGTYSDPDQVNLTPYDPVEHAWVRIREASGTVYWDTSPDETTWTTRRTLATPSWVTTNLCSAGFDTNRANGSHYAEFDNLNTTGVPDVADPPTYLRRVAPARR